jgi:hypothetical protein
MLELRQDILNGDFRVPYLAWLKVTTMEAAYDDDIGDLVEPPVPADLGKRSWALDTFFDFFSLDEDLVRAAAEASSASFPSVMNLKRGVAQLPEEDKNGFLLRLIDNEPGLHFALKKHLQKTAGLPTKQTSKGTRTVAELLERAEMIRQQRVAEEQRQAALKRQQELDKLAGKIPQLWEQVFTLIGEKRTKSYEQAVAYLVDLRDLARRDGEEAEFQARINQIYKTYYTLHRTMRNRGFTPD